MLSLFTTMKMEMSEEPAKVMRRVNKVAQGLPNVGRTVEDDQKHIAFLRRLKQG